MTSPSPEARRWNTERILAVVGAVALPLGLALVVLGWYGAAHSSYLFEQVPYLISGGLLGLGLVFLGGFLYFAALLTRSASSQQRHTEQVAALLLEIREELRDQSSTAPARTVRGSQGPSPFVATAKGSMLHRPDCSVVAGKGHLRPIPASGDGLTPCTLCSPFSTDVATAH